MRAAISRIVMQEDLNFLLTNRLPRRLATTLVGRLSKVEQPLVRDLSITLWRMFSDVDLSDAARTRFKSMHDCFTRELRPGARVFDPDPAVLASPCDAIVGACGRIEDGGIHQIKGAPYRLDDLIAGHADDARFGGGSYVTLRLTAGMYHRFHAPHDMIVTAIDYISGDCWNVNPIALKRVERLFCKNERAVIAASVGAEAWPILLVPVAAVLVASIRLSFLDTEQMLRSGPPRRRLAHALRKGEEMGWFEHGSTIIVFAPPGFALAPGIADGSRIKAGDALMRSAPGEREDRAGPSAH